MAEEKLNFFIMGKTGHGKSATGNMLLDGKVFKSSADASSVTKDVYSSFAILNNFRLMIIDGPGLEDTAMNKVEDKQAIVRSMSKALMMCSEGIDAFLLVFRFGTRFTDEEQSALHALKRLFGDGYLDRMIVVVTHGASFYDEMEEKGLPVDFPAWCRKQEGAFQELYKSCRGRFVLVENREKDSAKKQAQRMEIVNHAARLKILHGRYNSECFEQAKFERKKLIVELKAPILKEKIQEDVSLLVAEIEKFSETSAKLGRQKIMDRVRELLDEIHREDQGCGLLEDLRKQVERVELHLDNTLELIQIGKALEKAREATDKWSDMLSISAMIPCVNLLTVPIGATGLAVANSKEKKLQESYDKVLDKRGKLL